MVKHLPANIDRKIYNALWIFFISGKPQNCSLQYMKLIHEPTIQSDLTNHAPLNYNPAREHKVRSISNVYIKETSREYNTY